MTRLIQERKVSRKKGLRLSYKQTTPSNKPLKTSKKLNTKPNLLKKQPLIKPSQEIKNREEWTNFKEPLNWKFKKIKIISLSP
jgi:hypothetical protein